MIMKRALINNLIPGLMIFVLSFPVHSQKYEVRAIEDEYGYIAVQLRDTVSAGLPATSADITDIQFELRWPASYGEDVDVALICSDYKLTEGLGSVQSTGNYYWRVFAADSVPFHPAADWIVKQWETIGTFKVIKAYGTDTGFFAIASDNWVVQGLNLGIDGADYPARVSDSATNYVLPTIVWDWVWKGGATPASGFDEHSWTFGSNWTNECGDIHDAALQPGMGNNCFIPGGIIYFPTNFNNFTYGLCYNLKMKENSYLEIPAGIPLYVTGTAEARSGSQIIIRGDGSLNIETQDK